jgi:hypothetical protein
LEVDEGVFAGAGVTHFVALWCLAQSLQSFFVVVLVPDFGPFARAVLFAGTPTLVVETGPLHTEDKGAKEVPAVGVAAELKQT